MESKKIFNILRNRQIFCLLGCLIFCPSQATANTWDLSDLYPDNTSWAGAYQELNKQIAELENCRNKLGESGQKLAACLSINFETYKNIARLYTYSFLAKDTDLGNSKLLERHVLAEDLENRFQEATSYVKPELLAIGAEKLLLWQKKAPALADYDFLIKNTLRNENHVLSARQEEILSAARAPLRTADMTYNILVNAEIPRPTITLSSGEAATLDNSGYTKFRGTENRVDRKAVFDNFFASYRDFQQTIASTLAGQVQAHAFEARMRNYASSLQQALATDNIPEEVYHTLVSTVNNNLDTFHRYLRMHARLLNIKQPRYYDIYPAVADLNKRYSLQQSQRLLSEALKPLGNGYVELFDKSASKRWMHALPAERKRSGAYATGAAYDVHPYILMNYNEDFESLSTFAHEWGHAMHSLLTNRAQPFAKADYATFLAEIASISHEILLYKHLGEGAKNSREKLYYLFAELQGLRGTFFRQTQFAEFELAIHKEVENGGALSAAKLNDIYLDILRRYYGHSEEVVLIDKTYAIEWAYIPHFYRNFYVYQYATSISAAYFLMENILNGDDGDRQKYLSVLAAGGSDYPYDILRRAGADMANSAIYESVIRRCNQLMDEIEDILSQHPELATR